MPFNELESGSTSPKINHLLLIAIEDYKDAPLENCLDDADALLEVFKEKYGFDPNNIKTLYNEQATFENIEKTLKDYKQKVKDSENFLVFFSGHGVNEDGIHSLVTYDKEPGTKGIFYPFYRFKIRLNEIKSFHTVVILDCCFSGGLFVTTTKSYDDERDIEAYAHTSRWGIASCHTRQVAYDGSPGENSPFTTSLVNILKRNERPMGIQQLGAEITAMVAEKTRSGTPQTSICRPLAMTGDDLGQFVFFPKAAMISEDEFWKNCLHQNTEAAFKEYEDKYPEGKYYKEALQKILYFLSNDTSKSASFAEKSYSLEKKQEGLLVQETIPSPQVTFGTFLDKRDGQKYKTITVNNQTWMAQNLNYDLTNNIFGLGKKDCWQHGGPNRKWAHHFGRVYTWKGAIEACPPGWRLPTIEDWKELTRAFGGFGWRDHSKPGESQFIIEGDPQRAYAALLDGGNSGFAVQLPSGGNYYVKDGEQMLKLSDVTFWSASFDLKHKKKNYYSTIVFAANGMWGNPDHSVLFSFSDENDGLPCRYIKD